jgi:hypothetical protein
MTDLWSNRKSTGNPPCTVSFLYRREAAPSTTSYPKERGNSLPPVFPSAEHARRFTGFVWTGKGVEFPGR